MRPGDRFKKKITGRAVFKASLPVMKQRKLSFYASFPLCSWFDYKRRDRPIYYLRCQYLDAVFFVLS
jgi:hypothetical protein